VFAAAYTAILETTQDQPHDASIPIAEGTYQKAARDSKYAARRRGRNKQ